MPKLYNSFRRWKLRQINLYNLAELSCITMSKRRPIDEKDHAYAQKVCGQFLCNTKRVDYDERSDKGWSTRMIESTSSDEPISVGQDLSSENNPTSPTIELEISSIETLDLEIPVHINEGSDDSGSTVDTNQMEHLSLQTDYRVGELFAVSNEAISKIFAESQIKCKKIRADSEETCQRIWTQTAKQLERMRLESKEKIAQIEAENNLKIAELFRKYRLRRCRRKKLGQGTEEQQK